jgi:hypothetical protein
MRVMISDRNTSAESMPIWLLVLFLSVQLLLYYLAIFGEEVFSDWFPSLTSRRMTGWIAFLCFGNFSLLGIILMHYRLAARSNRRKDGPEV